MCILHFLFLASVLILSNAEIKQNRDVSGFKSIEVSGPFSVDVDVGGTEGAAIVAALNDTDQGQDVVDHVGVTVENQVLKIRFLPPYDMDYSYAGLIQVHVSAKSVSDFVLSGSGVLTVNSELTVSVSAVMSGSGNITLIVNNNNLNVVLSGSGFVNLRGNTEGVNFVVSGAGKILGEELHTNTATIAIYGAGDVNVQVQDSLSVVQMGSGTVRYGGNPKTNIMTMGAGAVIKLDQNAPHA